MTGESITVDSCHVDHDAPTFVELAHRFADQVGGYELIKVVTEDGANGTRLLNPNLEALWQGSMLSTRSFGLLVFVRI